MEESASLSTFTTSKVTTAQWVQLRDEGCSTSRSAVCLVHGDVPMMPQT